MGDSWATGCGAGVGFVCRVVLHPITPHKIASTAAVPRRIPTSAFG